MEVHTSRIHGAKSNKSSLHIFCENSLPWGFQLIKCQIHHGKLHQITLTNILSFEAFAAAVRDRSISSPTLQLSSFYARKVIILQLYVKNFLLVYLEKIRFCFVERIKIRSLHVLTIKAKALKTQSMKTYLGPCHLHLSVTLMALVQKLYPNRARSELTRLKCKWTRN